MGSIVAVFGVGAVTSIGEYPNNIVPPLADPKFSAIKNAMHGVGGIRYNTKLKDIVPNGRVATIDYFDPLVLADYGVPVNRISQGVEIQLVFESAQYATHAAYLALRDAGLDLLQQSKGNVRKNKRFALPDDVQDSIGVAWAMGVDIEGIVMSHLMQEQADLDPLLKAVYDPAYKGIQENYESWLDTYIDHLNINDKDKTLIHALIGNAFRQSSPVDLSALMYVVAAQMPNSPTNSISMMFQARGPNPTYTAACAGGLYSMTGAMREIEAGRALGMIAGGTDKLVQKLFLQNFSTALSDDGVLRPFGKDRNGTVIGDGAFAVYLHDLEDGLTRGWTPYAVLSGASSAADAFHYTDPGPGVAMAMKKALEEAGYYSDVGLTIDAISIHGTGTKLNGKKEGEAINQIYGELAGSLLIIGAKSRYGHTVSAPLQVLDALLALNGYIPPTLGTTVVDPLIGLKVVLEPDYEADTSAVQVNGLGFGGANASIILEDVTAFLERTNRYDLLAQVTKLENIGHRFGDIQEQ